MDKKMKKKWVKALRSKKFKQGKSHLKQKDAILIHSVPEV